MIKYFLYQKNPASHYIYIDLLIDNINADTVNVNNSGITSGYYDVIYNGKSGVLVKIYKEIQSAGVETYFNPKRDFFIRKNNAYYSVSGQGDLIAALKDRKKELQQYIKTNKIKFHRDPEEAMVKIASYYDQLSK